MKPEEANTKNCKVVKVVYNDGDFSYAYLYLVDERKNVLGARWNFNYGTGNDLGSPNHGQYPKWLYLPDNLLIPTLNSLEGLSGTNEDIRLEVIQAFTNNQVIMP